MKVHRIITTIEVENDNSITSVELTKLHLANTDIPLAVTNMTTNGSANDINKVYAIVNNHRPDIGNKLKISFVLLMMVLMIMNVVLFVLMLMMINMIIVI